MNVQLFTQVMAWLVAAAFAGVALATAREWWRHREPGRGYLALAIGLLGSVAVVAEVGSGRVVGALTIFMFLGAGYALLAFRHVLIPLGPRMRRVVIAVGALTAVVAPWEISAPQPKGFDLAFLAGTLLFVAVWCTYVGEPVVRFWLASRRLPSVQRARLRALSAGYAGVVLVLVVSIASSVVNLTAVGDLVVTAVPLAILPFLAAGFAPPVWLRRIWRADEEEAFTRSTQELMLGSPSPEALVAGGLDWAVRLVGGQSGFIVRPDGRILATRGITEGEARAVFGHLDGQPRLQTARSVETGQSILRAPIVLGGQAGSLVVLAGAFTPVFGTDEVTRLGQYGAALGIAMDREQLAEALRVNAEEVERLNHDLEARVAHRTRELRDAGRRTATILESVADAIVTIDSSRRIISFNHAAESIFERPGSEAMTLRLSDLVADGSREDFVRQVRDCFEQAGQGRAGWAETEGMRADGETFPLEYRLSRIDSDGEPLIVTCMRDISERQQYLAQLEYQALHDSLTGLPNRALFNDRIRQAVVALRRSGRRVSVLLIDLDHFKEVNDTLGHGAGDVLLQRVADRLTAKVRASDTIARLGGDEFAVLLSTAGKDTDMAVARKLIGSLREPFLIEGRRIHVSASAGLARFEEGGELDALLRYADVAMYVAKRERSGCVLYAADRDSNNPLKLTLQGDLRRAIQDDELQLHFQPIVEMVRGELVAVEALVRWRHPEHGLLSPDRFIPAAEDSDLIHDLTAWVLAKALDGAARLQLGDRRPAVAVNISPRSLTHPGMPRLIAQQLRRSGVDPSLLRLEVTETAAMTGLHGTQLKQFERMGVSLSIDDFGTGHSSLARLRELPVHELKIDRSFVLDMGGANGSTAIVRSTIELAHSLDLKVVAEGVETEQLWTELRRLGCDTAQGYLIARPMPLDDLLQWVERRFEAPEQDLVIA